MNNLTLTLNTATNVFILPPVWKCYEKGQYSRSLLYFSCFMASSAMYMTETKHQLQPPFFKKYSNYFLNLDRFVAFLTFLSILPNYKSLTKNIVIEFLLGLFSIFIGENTQNPILYNITHTIWHYVAFDCLYKMLE